MQQYHRGFFNHSSITEAVVNIELSQRPPQTQCHHQGCCKCSAIAEAAANVVLSLMPSRMRCYHQGRRKGHAVTGGHHNFSNLMEGFCDHSATMKSVCKIIITCHDAFICLVWICMQVLYVTHGPVPCVKTSLSVFAFSVKALIIK